MGINEWPESLRRYVERCFAMCTNTMDKDRVEIILKGKLTSASRDQSVLTKDWDKEPLPNLKGVSISCFFRLCPPSTRSQISLSKTKFDFILQSPIIFDN